MRSTEATDETPVFNADFAQDLHAHYAQLRAAGPAHQIVAPGGVRLWVITRYEEARAALSDPRLSKNVASAREMIDAKLPPDSNRRAFTANLSAHHLLNMDPPDHTRLRKLVVKAFTPRRIEALAPRVAEIATSLLDAMTGQSEVDLLDAFAFPLPIQVISELLGVDESRRNDFRAWTTTLLDSDDRESSIRAAGRMAEYLGELIAAKRAEPGDDLLTDLIYASEDEDLLSEHELVSTVFLLLAAGHETTVNLIGNGVLALLRNPGQWAALRADPSLVNNAVEEILRFEGPVTHGTFRYTTEPVRYGDVEIPEGEFVWVGLSSANHDPNRFADPERFDITRDAHGHLAFGHGIHFCLGAQLARMEAQIALRLLVERFPTLAPAFAPDDLHWRFSSLIHGLVKLPVHPRGDDPSS